MDFIDQLKTLSARMAKQIENITTEEATKNAFVMPFIQALGYDVFDPTEVVPEFTADVGSKKGEKVDYAILTNGKPTLLFECKCCASDLNECHAAQLRRYFHVTSARIGVLTNGSVYRFYSDLEEKNIMDEKPFMEIDLLDIDEQIVPELKRLTKSSFELDKMLSTANDLKYTREVKNFLEKEMAAPSVDFVRLILNDVYSGKKTQIVIEQFTPLIKKAFSHFVNDQISDRLKSAMTDQTEDENNQIDEDAENETQANDNGIETTEEEMDGFYIVRAILHEVVDVSRVIHRDTKSYFGVLLDDNNRKPICRLRFNTSQKYIGVFDDQKAETKHAIQGLNDIYSFADEIKQAITYYE